MGFKACVRSFGGVTRRASPELLAGRELQVLEVFFQQGPGWAASAKMLSEAAGKRYHEGGKTMAALSPTWAGVVCRRLAGKRLLKARSAKAKSNGVPTTFYSLPEGYEGFRIVALWYCRSQQQAHTWWVSSALYRLCCSPYGRAFLTPAMVRHELERRGVRMNLRVRAPESLWRQEDRREGPFRGRTFSLALPVVRDETQRDSAAERAIEECLSEGDPLEEEVRAFLRSHAARHYAQTESEKLVVPIAALCQASPTALVSFLSKWEPFDLERAQTPEIGMVEHVIFRMVFDCVQDLSVLRNTPDGLDVTFATVGPENGGCVEGSATILELDWGYDHRIGFAAGFDTDHTVVFGEDVEAGGVEVERNPENAWVQIAWVKKVKPPWLQEHRAVRSGRDYAGLEFRLGHTFADKALLETALTHSSFVNEHPDPTREENSRLEFLGDALVELAVRQHLFESPDGLARGRMSERADRLVSNENLADIARALDLGRWMDFGRGEEKDNLRANRALQANAVEAIIGAVSRDADVDTALAVALRLIEQYAPAQLDPAVIF